MDSRVWISAFILSILRVSLSILELIAELVFVFSRSCAMSLCRWLFSLCRALCSGVSNSGTLLLLLVLLLLADLLQLGREEEVFEPGPLTGHALSIIVSIYSVLPYHYGGRKHEPPHLYTHKKWKTMETLDLHPRNTWTW